MYTVYVIMNLLLNHQRTATSDKFYYVCHEKLVSAYLFNPNNKLVSAYLFNLQ